MNNQTKQRPQVQQPQPQRQPTQLEAAVMLVESAIEQGQAKGAYTLKEASRVNLGLETLKAYLNAPKADAEVLLKFGQFLFDKHKYKREATIEDFNEFAQQGEFKKPEPAPKEQA